MYNMRICVAIDAPELASAIRALAEALKVSPLNYQELCTLLPDPEIVEPEAEELEKEIEAREEAMKKILAKAETEKETPKITLETVRAKLAALSQSGKQAEVKKLITSFKAKKLTEIPQEKYPELLKKAEDI